MKNILVNVIAWLVVCLLAGSCTGNSTTPENPGLSGGVPDAGSTGQDSGINTPVSWPSALPVDALQPWEELNPEGFAVPAEGWPRKTSSLNLDSDFTPGVERHSGAGDVADYGEASRLASGDVGGQNLSYAIYRVLGGGAPLGVVTADVNLHPNSLGSASEYWLGVADYGKGGWSWHGPFTDSHVRLQMPDSGHASLLGNYYVCVVAYDGASFDVVGVGTNARDVADTTAPAAPGALVHIDYGSSAMLEWLPVADGDIAGYKVYYHHSAFVDGNTGGLRVVGYLVGDSQFLLTGLQAKTYVRVAAVDLSGNEGPVSEMARCTPLADSAIESTLEVDAASGMVGGTFNLTATGGDTYDFDLDGDGTFDVMGNVSGIAALNATQTGIIRPLVRANSADGMSIALGAVSLIVSGNSRPIAWAYSDTASGNAPLPVSFEGNGFDYDGSIVSFAWDFEGDGIWDYSHSSNPNPPTHVYETGGLYNAKFRVIDDQAAWDIDTLAIHVTEFAGFDWLAPDYHTGLQYPDFAIIDGHPAFTYISSLDSTLYFIRALNPTGTQWGSPIQIDTVMDAGYYSSLAMVNGVPAVAYFEAPGTEIYFLYSDDPQGTAWTTPRVLVDPTAVITKMSLEVVAGNPAIGYAGPGDAMYIRADSVDGSTWGNAPVVVDSSGSVGPWLDMEVIDGNPAMAYYDLGKAYYIRATTNTGNLAADWADPRVNVSGVANCGGWVNLEYVSGRPAISYYENTGIDKIIFHRAVNSTGQTGLDWPVGFIEIESGSSCGIYSGMGVVNGLPVVCFYMAEGFPNYYYCSASNPEGTSWNNPIGILNGLTLLVGDYAVILEHNNAPYLGSYNMSNSTLFFAHPVFE